MSGRKMIANGVVRWRLRWGTQSECIHDLSLEEYANSVDMAGTTRPDSLTEVEPDGDEYLV